MIFSNLSPYELGKANHEDAIPFLVNFLKEGTDNEKRLAASAITKLAAKFPKECVITFPYFNT